ncbi:histidine phosphatase family protein [Halobacillus litoralis]|uniref:histidine phosphatase family protein n=1 Tax=Halobacillus litoralis TaxID=45668 RepID=UPI001CFCAFD7|nr:histidine phosphatase family protein [Halobacillus litoralis]
MTKIAFIRHGSTSWNKEKRAQGSSDIPLDYDGKEEAVKLADRLKDESWDLLYSSPLGRAKQTAEEISRRTHLKVHFDPRLREAGGGQIEGTTEQERVARWGEGWRSLDLGWEPRGSVIKRGVEFIEAMLDKHKGSNILVVSHGALIGHLLRELDKKEDLLHDDHMKNTSVSVVMHEGGSWTFNEYNCTKHLEG